MNANIIRTSKGIGAALLFAALTACGSGLNGSSSSSSPSSGGGSSTSTGIRIGSGTGASFQNGTLAIASNSLSAGGSTSITVTVVDAAGTLYTAASVTVNFNSPCFAAGKSSIVDSTGTSGSASTNTGTVIVTYTAKGCSGADAITATAAVNSQSITATGSITVAAAALGSVQFVSALPSTITLKGMGGTGLQQTSTVIFAVKDSVGGAVPGANVTFALVSSTGGVTLSTKTAVSDANGQVQTIVQAGTFSGPVVVQASIVVSGVTISTQSSGLSISSGVPAQAQFSLAVAKHSMEAWDLDGATDVITVRVGDRFGNPVPDGTTVSFQTRNNGAGGFVDPACSTAGGACTATWTGKNPRPVDSTSISRIGYAYILAFAVGEESFIDQNGDGVFDTVSSVAEPFTDQGEIFAPSGEFAKSSPSSSFQSGDDYFDYDSSNTYTAADGLWEGINCQAGSSCATSNATGVGTYLCIIMASSEALFTNYVGTTPVSTGVQSVTVGTGVTISVTISDVNHNPMPAGTTVTLQTGNLQNVAATIAPNDGSTSFTWPDVACSNNSGDTTFQITLTPPTGATSPPAGNFTIVTQSPSGIKTNSDTITVQ